MANFKVTLVDPTGIKQTLNVPENQYILEAAEDAGIVLPFNCRAGACSSCTAKIIKGSVNQSEGYFLHPRHLSDQFVLLCVAYPTSDCVIETDKEVDLE